MDDISDVIVDDQVPSLLARAESRARETVEWLLDNGMALRLHKSMIIVKATKRLRRPRNIPSNLALRVQGQVLTSVESTKLFGLTLNQDLTW